MNVPQLYPGKGYLQVTFISLSLTIIIFYRVHLSTYIEEYFQLIFVEIISLSYLIKALIYLFD